MDFLTRGHMHLNVGLMYRAAKIMAWNIYDPAAQSRPLELPRYDFLLLQSLELLTLETKKYFSKLKAFCTGRTPPQFLWYWHPIRTILALETRSGSTDFQTKDTPVGPPSRSPCGDLPQHWGVSGDKLCLQCLCHIYPPLWCNTLVPERHPGSLDGFIRRPLADRWTKLVLGC